MLAALRETETRGTMRTVVTKASPEGFYLWCSFQTDGAEMFNRRLLPAELSKYLTAWVWDGVPFDLSLANRKATT